MLLCCMVRVVLGEDVSCVVCVFIFLFKIRVVRSEVKMEKWKWVVIWVIGLFFRGRYLLVVEG